MSAYVSGAIVSIAREITELTSIFIVYSLDLIC
jgi:hypothetical protein